MRFRSAPLHTAVAVVVVSACGSAQLRAASPTLGRTSTSAAATTVPITTTAASPSTSSPAPSTSAVPSPSTSPASPASSTGGGARCPAESPRRVLTEQVRTNGVEAQGALDLLQPDLQAADTYGHAHPDEWMGVTYSVDPARVTARFSAHVADHQVALAKLVAHPDLVDVLASPHTPADVQHVAQEVLDDIHQHPDRVATYPMSWSPGMAAFFVGFGPGEEAQAAAYVARWGDLVDIDVASRPYVPDGCGTPSPPLPCPVLSTAKDPATAGITVTIVDAPASIHRTGDHGATLVITNVGTSRFTLASGIATGDLVVPGTDRVVGMYTGGIKAVGIQIDLAPGDDTSVDVAFSAASCGDQATTAVVPGTYGLRAILPDSTSGPMSGYLSAEIPITVTA